MAQSLDPTTREALLTRVRFYRDLGLTEFYRRPVDPALAAQFAAGGQGLASENWKYSDQDQTLRTPSFPLLSAERVGDHEADPPGARSLDSETMQPLTGNLIRFFSSCGVMKEVVEAEIKAAAR